MSYWCHKSGGCYVTYVTVWIHTRWHIAQWWKKCVNGKQPWEGIRCAEDNTKSNKRSLKGGTEKLCWHDSLHWTQLDCANNVPPQTSITIVTSLKFSNFWYIILSWWVKYMQLSHTLLLICFICRLEFCVSYVSLWWRNLNQSWSTTQQRSDTHPLLIWVHLHVVCSQHYSTLCCDCNRVVCTILNNTMRKTLLLVTSQANCWILTLL